MIAVFSFRERAGFSPRPFPSRSAVDRQLGTFLAFLVHRADGVVRLGLPAHLVQAAFPVQPVHPSRPLHRIAGRLAARLHQSRQQLFVVVALVDRAARTVPDCGVLPNRLHARVGQGSGVAGLPRLVPLPRADARVTQAD